MEDLPIITTKGGQALWKDSFSMAVTGGLASFGSALSKAVDRITYDPHGLLQMLHIRLYEQGNAKSRGGNFLGRFWNRATGVNAEYIELSGTHLAQVLEMAEVKAPEGLKAGTPYLLRQDIARLAYKALREKLG